MADQLTGTAQIFADVLINWSPEAIERVTGNKLDGLAEHGIIHLITLVSAALDGSCKQRDSEGKPTMKPHWEISFTCRPLAATEWCRDRRILPWWRLLFPLPYRRRCPLHHDVFTSSRPGDCNRRKAGAAENGRGCA
ncbi:hypothetical protein ACNKHN_15970 [Shigella flexneri]